MNRQQAINYLLSSGFSEEQINTIEQAFKQEPTNDLVVDCISRQAVIDLMMQKWGENFSGDDAMQESMDDIRALPSVTLQEPRKGHWEHGKELSREYQGKTLVDITYEDWHCSNCHCVIEQSSKPKWSYCPSCGAKMVEPQERGFPIQ